MIRGATALPVRCHVINLANANHTGTAAAPDLIQFTTGSGTISVNAVNGGALAFAADEVVVLDATTVAGYTGTPSITLDGTSAGVGLADSRSVEDQVRSGDWTSSIFPAAASD